jgi:hypothetical protein
MRSPSASRLHRFRQPEVQHSHGAVRADLDVRGFQIAIDDPLLSEVLELIVTGRRRSHHPPGRAGVSVIPPPRASRVWLSYFVFGGAASW